MTLVNVQAMKGHADSRTTARCLHARGRRCRQRRVDWTSVLWNAAMAHPLACCVATAVTWEWLTPGVGPPGASRVAVAAARTQPGAIVGA
jgi:hypothetical protein